VNELYARELAPDTGGGTVDLSYDFAGNLLRPQLQSGGALRYTHDAWNRLVKVELEDAEEDLHPRAEYEYNPLNWRTVERTDTNTTDSTHALDEMRVHLYDASWRLLESRIDSDFDPEETSPDFEEHAQLVWGLRYIDDIVSTRRDLNPSEEDGAEVRMFHATDAQFSSVAVLQADGTLGERVAYTAYGVARHQWRTDVNGDGAVGGADLAAILSSFGAITAGNYTSEADLDRNGVVNATDLTILLSYYSLAALPEGTLSSPAVANRTGYCGYRFAPETEMYLARNRWNSPPLGRWIERDPLEYIDGMGLYEYVGGTAASAVDPWGLSTATGDQWWKDDFFDLPRAIESSRDCFVLIWTDRAVAGHWWIEFLRPSGELGAVGYWPFGWMTPAPDIQRIRRNGTKVFPRSENDPYLEHRLRNDKTKLPMGASPVSLRRADQGHLRFGLHRGMPCANASCAMIRDCLEKFEPSSRPYGVGTNNCRVGLADAYLSCCLRRGFGPSLR